MFVNFVWIKFSWILLGFLSMKIYIDALHSVLGILFAAPDFWILEYQFVYHVKSDCN